MSLFAVGIKSLILSHNDIGDDGLQALAASLANGNTLGIEKIDLSGNRSFSAVGFGSFSSGVLPTSLNGLQALTAAETKFIALA